ncbi:thiamine diphosphate-binding protein [Mytilinidion resinicola]|uniref:Pyruvate decarboxylase n=1 Tax=Mytilinidion resinicola TaxID=574789 RepID=A0A6A6YVL7_9PEZI|nr:thiamine diphosphate-binding protein [Mytilinidion resinicola]KAF2812025.1 thiamine diphosphate-binding protein [Mytilinidion resinicola]
MATVLLAEYLFTRLRQLGVGSVHGDPGDYNLDLLDYVAPAGLCWVGNVNELNAGYAADGFARIKGIGALITTFGVGELSAINAIAGAYAEHGESRALGIVEDVQALIKSTNWPSRMTPYGKGLFDETLSNFHGVYKGKIDDPAPQELFDQADLIMCLGPHWSSSNTYEYSTIPKADANVAPREPITHDKLWRIFSEYLLPDDIILEGTGTAGHGIRELLLPPLTRLFGPATWLSIEYMLPAAQGAALAQRELQQERSRDNVLKQETKSGRTILFIGDDSFQMTAQELSTIIRHDLNVVVFLINNNGYTIERCIHGLHERYNAIARWRYLRAPSFFGVEDDAFTTSVGTWEELDEALNDERLMDGKGLRMVELCLDREDVPRGPLVACLERERRQIEGVMPRRGI